MSNNKAILTKVSETIEINGADRIHIAVVLGEHVIVSKDVGVGSVGVLFPVGVELADHYCHKNNLFRNKLANKDKEKSGFFEESRRVRAQPFLKVRSEGYFAPLESFDYLGGVGHLALGETFDELGGKLVCKKYISEASKVKLLNQSSSKKHKVGSFPFFEKHVDSDQFKYFGHKLKKGDILSFHAKVHGTSARMSLSKKEVEIPWYKSLFNKIFGEVFPSFKWEYVVGTRNVIISDKGKNGFHGSEGFRFDVMEIVKPHLEKGMTIFGEIAGYANGSPIMPPHFTGGLKDKSFGKKYGERMVYSYGCKQTEFRFHVYRITRMTEGGAIVDMTQKQMEKWCADRGIATTLEVHPSVVYDGDLEGLAKLVDELTERPELLCEDYICKDHISEGIIIRADGSGDKPKFFKSKSYPFKVLEGLCEEMDIEDVS